MSRARVAALFSACFEGEGSDWLTPSVCHDVQSTHSEGGLVFVGYELRGYLSGETIDADTYPGLLPVTRTLNDTPASAGCST